MPLAMLLANRKLSSSATKLRWGFLYTFQTLACQSFSGDPAMKCSCAWNLPVLHSGNQLCASVFIHYFHVTPCWPVSARKGRMTTNFLSLILSWQRSTLGRGLQQIITKVSRAQWISRRTLLRIACLGPAMTMMYILGNHRSSLGLEPSFRLLEILHC